MNNLKAKHEHETVSEQENDKPDGLELVITPKKEFLEWFKSTKGIIGELKDKKLETGLDVMECPNCRSSMENHELNKEPGELWHICTKCNLTFSQRQHRYFTTMIMRLVNGT
jgi:hypothetical protein